MSRRPANVTQADIGRAIKAAISAGLPVARVEIDAAGKIVIVAGDGVKQEADSPLDAWKATRNAHQA